MSLQHSELDELLGAIKATGSVFAASVSLHDELNAAGIPVPIPANAEALK